MAETTTVVRPAAAARPYARAAFEDAQAANAAAALVRTVADRRRRRGGSGHAAAAGTLESPSCAASRKPNWWLDCAAICAAARKCRRRSSPSSGCWPSFIACISFRASPSCSNGCARRPKASFRAQLISAAAVTDAQRKRVAKALKAKFQRNVELDCKTDVSLIAGAVIRVGDRVIDGSARGRLDKLAMALSQ